MVKICEWGTCNSDTRYSERVENIRFVPFPKPKSNFDKCLRWVKACGRPHTQLNPQKVTRHTYVCSKHFVGDKESQQNEESAAPESADQTIRSPIDHTDQLSSSPLDVLSAVAEMRSLQQQVQQQQQQLNQQTVLIQHLQMQQCENDRTPKGVVEISPLTIASILKQEEKVKGLFKYYTSLKYTAFLSLHKFLTLNCLPIFERKRKDIERMPSDQQLLLTLMRLRHNFGIKDLPSRFYISSQAVSEVFLSWIDHMYLLLGAIPIWPHRNDLINSMPQQFKVEFPTTMAIIDCTELKTQKPSSLKLQSQMYSDYKSSTTLKGLVACDPMGNIIFVSELHTGSMSDKDITVKSGFFKTFATASGIWVHKTRGFNNGR
ncbi:uncharacterized protein LOC125656555 [Ostrea edulis]|uniref:uncharacterized protein LOC125656555 n=1 Tax=Ostrea edulis TaxID=37623 RepID=UPI0024AF0287|nr:uncharacterized protein LOC125656555 [Ostrea edulis]